MATTRNLYLCLSLMAIRGIPPNVNHRHISCTFSKNIFLYVKNYKYGDCAEL